MVKTCVSVCAGLLKAKKASVPVTDEVMFTAAVVCVLGFADGCHICCRRPDRSI